MEYIIEGLKGAFQIIISFDREFLKIVSVSVKISFISTFLASVFGVPFGMWVALAKFKGRTFLRTILNTLMSLPTVVVGLLLYSLLSRKGPLGGLGILYTPAAMVMGQFILTFPIVAALAMGGIRTLGESPLVAARLLGAGRIATGLLFLREAKSIIIVCVLAGFGRVFGEVGVSMMLGGNIRFYTRNITTAIALETSKGAFSLGIALGIVLLVVAFLINATVYHFQRESD
ncbi:MAG TPA: ABC transporter permease subunit [Candidatus Omnitrophica bacterium]|nr:ABC transporter permease subunit [Candidatus Omnitrophota bacterium]